MRRNFRDYHLLEFLSKYESENLPLDVSMNLYFRENKAIGSKDRAQISDTAYELVRWRGSLDYLMQRPYTWEKRWQLYRQGALKNQETGQAIPSHIRVSFPKFYFDYLKNAYGEEKALEYCLISNTRAPITIRVNPLKTDRETLWSSWEGKYDISKCSASPWGIRFHQKILFSSLPEYKEGMFEVQDEASQLIAKLVAPSSTDHVLDYCAGSGGKSLAFAAEMAGKGQIYLHDIRKSILYQAKKRLKRAGIQNFQLLLPGAKKIPRLKGKFDIVLVDVPCSGSGTLRRNPDLKWNFSPEKLNELIGKQRAIFEEALSFVKPGGKIVYATCSILPQENENQIAFFTRKHLLYIAEEPLHTYPEQDGMDGFFGAVLQKPKC